MGVVVPRIKLGQSQRQLLTWVTELYNSVLKPINQLIYMYVQY